MTVTFAAPIQNFHFLRPAALLLLLALPLIWLFANRARADAGAWRAAVDAHLLPHLIEHIDEGRGRAGVALAIALWTLACVALAGPAWEREAMPLYRNQSARVIALELAPSMLAQDEKPNRLTRARFKINDILDRSRDYQSALIGYGADAFVAAPLTDDVETVRNLVDALDPATMPVAGNATARAIDKAVALIEQAGLHQGEVILVADSVGDEAEAESAAERARARGIRVSVLGVGTTTGAPVPLAQGDFAKSADGNVIMSRVDPNELRAVASAGGGRYAALSADASDLATLLANDSATMASGGTGDSATDSVQSARWRDRGPWLVLLMLPLALAGFRRGWLLAFAFAAVLPIAPARAASFADLWQRPDQQAAAALARGDAKRALEVARKPDWQAGAAYRAQDYASAAESYAKLSSADAAYNRGNALAKSQRYEEAIAAYDEALRKSPGMADAKANRSAVEAFLKQQKEKQDQSQQDKSQQDKSQQDKAQQDKSQQDKPQQDQSQQDSQNQSADNQGKPSDQSKNSDASQAQRDAAANDNEQQKKPEQQGTAPSKDGREREDQAPPAADKAPDAQQQDALAKSIDEALAKPANPDKQDPSHERSAPVLDEATREKQQTQEQWLQRVPDDPGGLLRRKFQLEYERRQQGVGERQ